MGSNRKLAPPNHCHQRNPCHWATDVIVIICRAVYKQINGDLTRIGIAPGIVVGQLQREGIVDYRQVNGHKQQLQLAKAVKHFESSEKVAVFADIHSTAKIIWQEYLLARICSERGVMPLGLDRLGQIDAHSAG